MSYANSRIPVSAQQAAHEQLLARVDKHLREPFRKPCLEYNRAALRQSLAGWDGRAPLILDAGCGVGHSTIALARAHPDHWVIAFCRFYRPIRCFFSLLLVLFFLHVWQIV